MYSSLMMVVAIIAPIPIIIKSMSQKITPFRAVLNGLLTGVIAALVIMVISDLSGSNVFEELSNQVDAMAKMLAQDPNIRAVMGENLTEDQLIKGITAIYDQSIKMLPAVVFIIAAIFAYIEYIIISKIYKPGGIAVIPMTKMREFDLPRNFAMVWLALYVLSIIITGTGIIENDIVFLNINYIFNFAFCIQGLSLIFMFCYSKRIPKILAILVVIVACVTNLGQTILMMVGFTDVIFGIKQRIKRVA